MATGEIAIPSSGVARGRSLDELHPQDEQAPGFTPEEARELTELVRSASRRVNDLIVEMYVGKAHLALGYTSWAQFCEKEELRLEFRPTIEQRRELHYFMFWLHGMPGRAVAAFTRCDQKTVAADAKAVYKERLAIDPNTPERPAVIEDTRGRARSVPTRPAEEVRVEASVEDLPAAEDDDIIDVVPVEAAEQARTQVTQTITDPDPLPEKAAEPARPPVPEQTRGREPDWPDQFEQVTRQMRLAIEKARLVMSHPRMKANLHNQPEGRLQEWSDWASEMVEWVAVLDGAFD